MEDAEKKECLKCLSMNLAGAAYCRFCHEKFNQAKIFVERKHRKKLNRKLLIAGGSMLAAAGGYLFKRRKAGQKKKQAS